MPQTTVDELLKQLSRSHEECEDSWYSCPLAPGGCSNDAVPPICNCGADAHNAILQKLIEVMTREEK